MKKSTLPWNIRQLAKMADKGTLSFEHPMQRKGDQWNALQQSLLIHSVSANFPVPPVLIVKEEGDNTSYVLDGKQRLTSLVSYVKDGFKLHPITPPVTVTMVDGDESEDIDVEIAGLLFSELDQEIQDNILSETMSIYRIEEATDDEIAELFTRYNNGTPLTKQQKARAVMGLANARWMEKLQKHPFMVNKTKLTPLQNKRSEDEGVILQAMMLTTGYEFESFVADVILQFSGTLKGKDMNKEFAEIEATLDYLDEVFDETHKITRKLHLPTLIALAKKAMENNDEKELFKVWADDFDIAISNGRKKIEPKVKTTYSKQFTGSGSVKKYKVLGRMDAMESHYKAFTEAIKAEEAELATV